MRLPVSFPTRWPRQPHLSRRIPWRVLGRPGSLLGLLLALILWTLAGLEPWQGQVVGVPDGDTIVVRDERDRDVRVRLYGIDAPELHQRGGEQARDKLLRMVMDRTVYLVTIDRDGYGRDVAHVRTRPFPWTATMPPFGDVRSDAATPSRRQDARATVNTIGDDLSAELTGDVNGDMLRAGQAWFYGEYCRLPYPCLAWYFTASKARETNIGLWKARNPTPPWEWRRKNR